MTTEKALCIIIGKKSNPLKGVLSFYNFYLKGEISKLIYQNKINLTCKDQIILYKNDICKMFPEKIIFFVNIEGKLEDKLKRTLSLLKISKSIIIREEENNG